MARSPAKDSITPAEIDAHRKEQHEDLKRLVKRGGMSPQALRERELHEQVRVHPNFKKS